MSIEDVLDFAPKEMRDDLALRAGVLYCSDVWQDDERYRFFESLAKQMGVTKFKFEPAEDFKRKFSDSGSTTSTEELSDAQNLALKLFREAFDEKATDIHISYEGSRGIIKFRRLGMLQDYYRLPGEDVRRLIKAIYNALSQSPGSSTFTEGERQDSRIIERAFLPSEVHSIRIHSEPTECSDAPAGVGTAMFLRLLYDQTEAKGGLEDKLRILGYDGTDIGQFRSLLERSGAVLISGPTGHGKSTLLKHIMESLAEEVSKKNYISIEDPAEFELKGVHQFRVMSKNDKDASPAKRAAEYTGAIAGSLRSDLDELMIGEIRYLEAAKAAVIAARSGHGVYATIHADSALGIIMRLVDLLSDPGGFSNPLDHLCHPNVLAGLIYQRLVPVLCPDCKIPFNSSGHVSDEERKYRSAVLPEFTFNRLMRLKKDLDLVCIRGHGCSKCDGLGIIRQTVAAEVIVTDETLLRHMRKGEFDEAYRYWIKGMGGRTHVQHALQGIAGGFLDPYLTELRLGVPLDFVQGPIE